MEKLLKTNQDLSKTENSAIKREAISVKGVVVGSRQGGGWLERGGGVIEVCQRVDQLISSRLIKTSCN